MAKYLVISYDADQECSYFDHVEAANADAALAIVGDARPYAVPVDAMTQQEVDSLGKLLRKRKDAPKTAYDLARSLDGETVPLETAITALPGRRFRLLKEDQNTVDRGEVVLPVGHLCTIGKYEEQTELFEVIFDANEAGEFMGWCLYSLDEIHELLEAL